MQNSSSTSGNFYFTAVFWGRKFTEYFIDLLLASLLAPGNIPALENKRDSKFVIATTEDDWHFIQEKSLFKLLKSYIDVIYINLGTFRSNQKMSKMSQGHQLIAELLFREKAIGVFVTPDLVLSNNAVVALQKQIYNGKKVILCPAIRFEHNGCISEFTKQGFLVPDEPFNISSRQLMRIALNNLHSETKTWIVDDPYYADNPVCSMWKAPGELNYIFHGYSWAPLAIDYAEIDQHDITTFELSTLDQDYVYRNFGLREDIYVVTDSDEIALVSFTDENDLNIPLIPNLSYRIPIIWKLVRKDKLRHFHYSPIHAMDPLKQKLISLPILLHSQDIHPSWEKTIFKAKKFIRSSIKSKPHTDILLSSAIYNGFHCYDSLKINLRDFFDKKSKEKIKTDKSHVGQDASLLEAKVINLRVRKLVKKISNAPHYITKYIWYLFNYTARKSLKLCTFHAIGFLLQAIRNITQAIKIFSRGGIFYLILTIYYILCLAIKDLIYMFNKYFSYLYNRLKKITLKFLSE